MLPGSWIEYLPRLGHEAAATVNLVCVELPLIHVTWSGEARVPQGVRDGAEAEAEVHRDARTVRELAPRCLPIIRVALPLDPLQGEEEGGTRGGAGQDGAAPAPAVSIR